MFGAVQAYQHTGSAPLTLCLRTGGNNSILIPLPGCPREEVCWDCYPSSAEWDGRQLRSYECQGTRTGSGQYPVLFLCYHFFPPPSSDASVHIAAHHASTLAPAALVGQQWGWSGSLLKWSPCIPYKWPVNIKPGVRVGVFLVCCFFACSIFICLFCCCFLLVFPVA